MGKSFELQKTQHHFVLVRSCQSQVTCVCGVSTACPKYLQSWSVWGSWQQPGDAGPAHVPTHHSLPQARVHPVSHHKAPSPCICLSVCLCLCPQQNMFNVLQGTAGTSSPTVSHCAHPREVQPYSTLPLLPHIVSYWGACFTEQHVGWWSITFSSQLRPSEDKSSQPWKRCLQKGRCLEAPLFFSLH